MREGSHAYQLLLAIGEKGLSDISALHGWVTNQMRGWLDKADSERLKFDLAISEQQDDLVELNLLKSTIALKQVAERSGGFSMEHGPALETAANALYDHCGWHDEDIAVWFSGLVMGEDGTHLGIDLGMVDDEEDDENPEG